MVSYFGKPQMANAHRQSKGHVLVTQPLVVVS